MSMYAPGENLHDIVGFVREAARRQVELAEQLAAFQRAGNEAGTATVVTHMKRLIVDVHSALGTLEDLSRKGRWSE